MKKSVRFHGWKTYAFKRCVAESNRPSWFCRPETKPLIQRTIWIGKPCGFSFCGCKGTNNC